MRILIVVATKEELEPNLALLKRFNIDIIVTGVGMVATSFALGRQLSKHRYDLIINIGIAGALSPKLNIGQVVHVINDRIFEFGAEDRENFISIEELGFGLSKFDSKLTPNLIHLTDNLVKCSGITVNKVHGDIDSINTLHQQEDPFTTESMEGAAVYYAAQNVGTLCLQVRSISNYIEPRDRSRWNIPLAITNVNAWLSEFLSRLIVV